MSRLERQSGSWTAERIICLVAASLLVLSLVLPWFSAAAGGSASETVSGWTTMKGERIGLRSVRVEHWFFAIGAVSIFAFALDRPGDLVARIVLGLGLIGIVALVLDRPPLASEGFTVQKQVGIYVALASAIAVVTASFVERQRDGQHGLSTLET